MALANIDMIIECDPHILNRKDIYIDKINGTSLKKTAGYVLADAVNIARQKGCLLVTETYPNDAHTGAFYIKCRKNKFTKDYIQQLLIDCKNEKTQSKSYLINLL